jgi:carbon monoxide dehydrogenase subunit G
MRRQSDPDPTMPSSAYVIGYQGRFHLPAPPMSVWSVLEDLDGFADKAVWLARLDIDGCGMQDGSVVRATIATPLPYHIRVRLELENCAPGRRIDARIEGDLHGVARLSLEAEAGGTRADLDWTIEIRQAVMRATARVASPVVRWGHDVVAEATIRSFADYVADEVKRRGIPTRRQ